MSEAYPKSDQTWLVSAGGDHSHGPGASLAIKFFPHVKHLSFDSAINLLEGGAEPDLILLYGKPDRSAQRSIARFKDSRPGVPVFLISHWEDADEMGKWISRSVMEAIQPSGSLSTPGVSNPYQLSSREIEVLRLMTRGLIKKEIGEQLSISYHTIVHHERSIYEKLNVHTRGAAVAKALMEKLC